MRFTLYRIIAVVRIRETNLFLGWRSIALGDQGERIMRATKSWNNIARSVRLNKFWKNVSIFEDNLLR